MIKSKGAAPSLPVHMAIDDMEQDISSIQRYADAIYLLTNRWTDDDPDENAAINRLAADIRKHAAALWQRHERLLHLTYPGQAHFKIGDRAYSRALQLAEQ